LSVSSVKSILEGVPEHVWIWFPLCHHLHAALEALADRG